MSLVQLSLARRFSCRDGDQDKNEQRRRILEALRRGRAVSHLRPTAGQRRLRRD